MALATESPSTLRASESVFGDSVAKSSSLQPLFEPGFCDVMPVDEAQLATQRAYILANPRSRLLRMRHRDWLQPQRLTVDTAVSLRGLYKYLAVEASTSLTDDNWSEIVQRLIIKDGRVICDSYGSQKLLSNRLLPVVCHRKDKALFSQQKARCLAEAANGAVLVSARIAKGEQEILDEVANNGFPIIRIEDNGFPEIYHPSVVRLDACAEGRLLLLTPWHYQFRMREENITVLFCKTMNCVVQAICKMRDDWWKK